MKRHALRNIRTTSRLTLLWLIGACAVLPRPVDAQPPASYKLADLKALQQAFIDLGEKVRPSVVAIKTYETARSGGSVKLPYSQGSGFILDREGYIATNLHVIDGADEISVILHDGLRHDARRIQGDLRSDLAIIKIDAGNLTPVKLGDVHEIKVNQWVFACGNPFGLANRDGKTSVTYGVVSALGRQMTQQLVGNSQVEYYGNMIETSATINPGNSGGPLFDIDGDVVGVVTAIETRSGVSEGHGFAIPIDKNTHRILDSLRAGREVRYGFLGVTVRDVDRPTSRIVVETSANRGALLDTVTQMDGPAARAGLRGGDVVVEYDGTSIVNSDHLVRLVGFTPVGTQVPVAFIRGNVKRTVTVTVGDRQEMFRQANADRQ